MLNLLRYDIRKDHVQSNVFIQGSIPTKKQHDVQNAPKYLGCRAWLLRYAIENADYSPLTNEMWLPSGRKHYYHCMYVEDARKLNLPDNSVGQVNLFYKVWRNEFPWLKIRTESSLFAKCGLCEFLHSAAHAATTTEARMMFTARLGRHYAFAAAQRLALSNLWAEASANPREVALISIYKMDQSKTMIPRMHGMLKTQIMKAEGRLVVGLVGVIIPGIFKQPHVITVFEDGPSGGEMQSSIIFETLMMIRLQLGTLPKKLIIHADNTTKETKNLIVLFFIVWLLAHTRNTPLQEVCVVFLMVGHTHDLVDQFFSRVSVALHGRDIYNMGTLWQVLEESMKDPPSHSHLRDCYAFKTVQPRELTAATWGPIHRGLRGGMWGERGGLGGRCSGWGRWSGIL